MFGLTVSEILSMVTWFFYFLAYDESKSHGGKHIVEQRDVHLMVARKHRKSERKNKGPRQDIPFEDMPPMFYFFQLGLTS